jgi:hypothetical protein
MIHARFLGESFGLACGEFSIKNKPVITYGNCLHRCHINILGDKAILYNNKKELIDIFNDYPLYYADDKEMDCYSQKYNPTAVMELFDRELIYPATRYLNASDYIQLNTQSYLSFYKLFFKMKIQTKKEMFKNKKEMFEKYLNQF